MCNQDLQILKNNLHNVFKLQTRIIVPARSTHNTITFAMKGYG